MDSASARVGGDSPIDIAFKILATERERLKALSRCSNRLRRWVSLEDVEDENSLITFCYPDLDKRSRAFQRAEKMRFQEILEEVTRRFEPVFDLLFEEIDSSDEDVRSSRIQTLLFNYARKIEADAISVIEERNAKALSRLHQVLPAYVSTTRGFAKRRERYIEKTLKDLDHFFDALTPSIRALWTEYSKQQTLVQQMSAYARVSDIKREERRLYECYWAFEKSLDKQVKILEAIAVLYGPASTLSCERAIASVLPTPPPRPPPPSPVTPILPSHWFEEY